MLDLAFDSTAQTAQTPASTLSQEARLDAHEGLIARMLDVIDYGLLLVSDEGRVIFTNRLARSELDEFHPLQLADGELRGRCNTDTATLKQAITTACSKGLQKLLTVGAGGVESTSLSVVPMHGSAPNGPATAMLILGRRQVCGDLSTEAFARQCNLTPAELRVLKQLCAGRSPSDIAKSQRVALCTVRTQIGELREKTGADSISALIRHVARLPPLPTAFRTSTR